MRKNDNDERLTELLNRIDAAIKVERSNGVQKPARPQDRITPDSGRHKTLRDLEQEEPERWDGLS